MDRDIKIEKTGNKITTSIIYKYTTYLPDKMFQSKVIDFISSYANMTKDEAKAEITRHIRLMFEHKGMLEELIK